MEEIEIKVADMVLTKFVYGSPRSWNINVLQNWLLEENQKHQDTRFSDLLTLDMYKFFYKIRTFLLTQNYIQAVPTRDDLDVLTEKGKIATELNGHSNYLKWAKKQNCKKKAEWFIVYIFLPVVTLAALIVGIIQLCKSSN